MRALCRSGGHGNLDKKATEGLLWSDLSLKEGTHPMANVGIALRELLRK